MFIIVYYLMFLPFCNIILGLLFSCENKFFTKLSLVDLRVHIFLLLIIFMYLILLLCLVCFLLRLHLFCGVFCRMGMSIGGCLVLGCYFDIRKCGMFLWMGRTLVFVWIFFRTILLCILAFLIVGIGLFFEVCVPIFYFETFLLCLGFPLRLYRIVWLFFCLSDGMHFVFCCFSCLAICSIF